MRQYLDRLPYPDSLPIFDTIVVDDLERVWVRQCPTPGQDIGTWRIFEAERRCEGRVQGQYHERLAERDPPGMTRSGALPSG